MRFHTGCALLVLSAYLSITQTAHAQYTFTTIDVPGAVDTFLTGVNDHGDIVGGYNIEVFGPSYAFFTEGDSFITIAVPGSSETTAFGINNNGKIVGSFVTGEQHGFLYSSKRQRFKQVDVPFPTGVFLTRVNGTNNRGQSVGEYLDQPRARSSTGFFTARDNSVRLMFLMRKSHPQPVSTIKVRSSDSMQTALRFKFMVSSKTGKFYLG